MKKKFKLTGLLITVCLITAAVAAPGVFADSRNIVLGREYTVTTGVEVSNSYMLYKEGDGTGYDINDGCLTDGKYAGNSFSNTGYHRAFRGMSRIISFELDEIMAVSGFKMSFYHSANSGIYAPSYINIYLSVNGDDYMLAGTAVNNKSLADKAAGKRLYELSFDSSYKARYIKLEYDTEVFSYADEIEVYGGSETGGAADITPGDYNQDEKGVFPKYNDSMNGAGDIIKIYDGYWKDDQSLADNTKDELLPYIAYLDQSGNILDTLFDSVAFVPCHGDYPSGGRLTMTSNKPGGIMTDWELYISKTFGIGINIDALNEAAKTRNDTLGISEKVKVFLTLPYPQVQDKAFGDIDSDGSMEYTRTLEERTRVLIWYIDEVTGRFDDGGYENLELCGFYWYRESVDNTVSDDEESLIYNIKEYIASDNLAVMYDPYFIASGFDKWEEIGFDGAVMQPNLIFRDYFKTEMLEEFAGIIKKYNLGVEIETAEPGNFNSTVNNAKNGLIYENYLYYGYKYGYMDSLHTFYQGAGPGTLYKFCKSSDSYMRYLYDITYKFIKCTYTMDPPTVEHDEFEVEADSSKNQLFIIVNTESFKKNIKAEVSAENGSADMLAMNTRISYTPSEGFTGTDIITLSVTDDFGQANTINIPVKVTGKNAEITSAETPAESTENEQDDGILGYILIGAVIAAAAAVLIFLIIKKKK